MGQRNSFDWQATTPAYQRLIDQLAQRRRDLGLTQEEVNDALGVADRLVNKWECYMKYPNFRHVLLWIEYLDCELHVREVEIDGPEGNPPAQEES